MTVKHPSIVMPGMAIVCAVGVWQGVTSAELRDDLRIVLDGVRASRLKLREGTVQLLVKDAFRLEALPGVETYVLIIDWKDDHVRAIERVGAADRRCAIRRDGTLIFREQGAEGFLDDALKGYSYSLFDPRLLGVYPVLSPSAFAAECLFPSYGWQATRAQEPELVDGRKCVVVRWAKNGVVHKYWIDPTGFRVRKLFDYNNRTLIESTYSESHVLPVRVTVTRQRPAGDVFRRTEFTLAAVHWGPVPDEVFTLAGLGLDVGAPVVDQRLHRRVGFWNGTGLSQSRHEALRAAAPPMRRDWSLIRCVLVLGGVGGVVAVLVAALRRARSSRVRAG